MSDESVLKALNQQYIDAFLAADVGWYAQHLDDDFVCIESDGSLLDKGAFLKSTAVGPDVSEYRLNWVRVRIFGDMALIHATGFFAKKSDGAAGMSRYTDVYARKGQEWKVVAAQVTRALGGAR